MTAAKFTDGEVNELRKAMATFRRRGTIGLLEEKMVSRMVERGYAREFAERCFNQIKGFGEYGFPESHAASFALLVYISAWLKRHHPAAFCAALLNSQPMGFYAPAQLVRDARENGVEAREVDINLSDWDCTLEAGGSDRGPALRLGFCQIDGMAEKEAEKLVAARSIAKFVDVHDLWMRGGIGLETIERLAAADSFRSIGLDRRQALWEVKALGASTPLPLFAWSETREAGLEPAVSLPRMALSQHVVNDYQTLRLSLKAHPMAFLRAGLARRRILACHDLRGCRDGQWASVAGVILVRQQPGTAKGVVFMTIEDETGVANIVVWRKTMERFHRVVMASRLIVVHGRIQRKDDIIHLVSSRLEDRSEWLALLSESGQADMPIAIARADEVLRPNPGSARRSDPPRRVGHPRNERILPKSRDFH
jgi:error-prone DNA polymerase